MKDNFQWVNASWWWVVRVTLRSLYPQARTPVPIE